jgi:hypothetical protein
MSLDPRPVPVNLNRFSTQHEQAFPRGLLPVAPSRNREDTDAASNIRARSTRLAGSVRDCAIDFNFAVSSSPSENSIARRHAAMILPPVWAHVTYIGIRNR